MLFNFFVSGTANGTALDNNTSTNSCLKMCDFMAHEEMTYDIDQFHLRHGLLVLHVAICHVH